MTIDNLVILLLIIIATFIFAHRLLYLLRLTNLGEGAFQWDRKTPRFRSLFSKGFGQHLVLRKLSGLGHFFIFWGFFFFALGGGESLLAGVFPGFSFAFLGPGYSLLNTGQDVLGLLVITALLISLFRRLILRPTRLAGPFSHTAEALVIVILILGLTTMFYGMNVFAPKQGWTPVTDLLRNRLPLWLFAANTQATVPPAIAWTHHLVFLGFLIYIPYSKHSHILFALPNIFLKDAKHPGLLAKLDVENVSAERFGAQNITDFKKKDLLDLFACSECGRCQESCPAYTTGKSLSPKDVIQDLKGHLLFLGPALVEKPASQTDWPLHDAVISGDSLWSCTTCRACDEACPVENSPMDKIMAIRQASVLMEGAFPEEARIALRHIESQSNPWGFPQEQRNQWAAGLGVKTLAEDPSVEYLLFVGCAGSYDQRYIAVSRALVKILQDAGVSFGILGVEERCTGDSARRIGNDYLAQELANENVATLNRYGVKKIITACPHCYNTLQNEYPQHGGNYEVIHHSQFIATLIETGKLQPPQQEGGERRKITYHDSCYLGRYNRITAEPRKIIARLAGAELIELPRNRKDSFCCGAGGGRMWMEEKDGTTTINVARSREVIASGANVVATACPFCMSMLADGITHENKGQEIQVLDIAEFFVAQRNKPGEIAAGV
jgi:Fe-S oxidoreductase